MKEADLLLRSSPLLDEGQSALTAMVVRLDRIEGPYAAILRARGRDQRSSNSQTHIGIGDRDVCWLTEGRVKGGDAST